MTIQPHPDRRTLTAHHTATSKRRIALVLAGSALLLCLALVAGMLHAEGPTTLHAEELADPPWLADCQRYQLVEFEGRCPGAGNPQREDPWAPTINILPPPDGLDCARVKLHIDQIYLADCDGDGEPGGEVPPVPALQLDHAAGVNGFFTSGSMVPDYGDAENGDILPIMECWDPDAMPEAISYKLDDPHFGEVYIATARVRMYCCDDC
jgi:hypothetical protein